VIVPIKEILHYSCWSLGPDMQDEIPCWDCRLFCIAVPRTRIEVLLCDGRVGLA
jgi:hypothetical protein